MAFLFYHFFGFFVLSFFMVFLFYHFLWLFCFIYKGHGIYAEGGVHGVCGVWGECESLVGECGAYDGELGAYDGDFAETIDAFLTLKDTRFDWGTGASLNPPAASIIVNGVR